MHYDLKITGGTIVDGSGKPGYVGDIGVHDGKIVALGAAPIEAEETIDATGLVVAPGFVDIHTHYDAQILWDRMLTISPWHGVTTVVMGNCGFGVAPTKAAHRNMILRTLEKVEGMSLAALEAGLGADWPFETFPEYMDALERQGMAINVGVLAGHTPIRTYVMGGRSRDALGSQCRRDRRHASDRRRGHGRRRARLCHIACGDASRLRRQPGAEPPGAVRGDRCPGRRHDRERPRHHAGHDRPQPAT